ncbi:MSP domain protein [Oesophagostomum dentatum]|uniref:Major sperm protein n=1 Tax=Oesophagostomum dentatum TaxID=61180 RepID=A0A0B1TKI7_OESDE|nr:MSP domain protein [Oesophagostomum dentatum]
METDDFYKLREGPGIENASLYPPVNIHEMLFAPLDKLVFNSPFDFDHVTYHMTVMNNTIHPVAFVIKANCIPRVIAYPAHGILKSKQKINVAVTMKKFDHEVYGENDRLVYEWVVLKEMVEEFKPVLLDTNGIVRRKTILIEYNG